MSKHYYKIPDYLNGLRLDKAISSLSADISRSQIQRVIKNGNLTVNKSIISNFSTPVKENDEIEFILESKVEEDLIPANIKLDIIYEDEYLIIINKNTGMITHPGAGNHQDTLANALLFHSNSLSDINGQFRPGIVHRLDKDTSGLMVVAKDNQTHTKLAAQIESRQLVRRYKALAWGMLNPVSGTIDVSIGRNRSDRKKMAALKYGGKAAITHYQTIEILHGGLFSLVECKLETGRTHQIRVHLSHIGHSIVGDQTYGNNRRKISGCPEYLKETLLAFNHQALHSFYISFEHPVTNKLMEFEEKLPSDYNNLLEFIRNKTN